MKLNRLAAPLLFASLVAGMAATAQTRSLPPPPIAVTVVNGQIAVSSEGLVTSPSQTSISWEMKTAGYRFHNASINFGAAQGMFKCGIVNSGVGIRCFKSAPDAGRYPYSISLVDQGTGALVELPQPSIFIQND